LVELEDSTGGEVYMNFNFVPTETELKF